MEMLEGRAGLGEKLLSLKRKGEELKSQRLEMQGELKSLTKQMEQQFKVKEIGEAEHRVEQMEEELQKMEKDIKQGIDVVENLMKGLDTK